MRPEKQSRYVLFAVKTAGEEQEVIPRCTSAFVKLLLAQKLSLSFLLHPCARVTNESP